MKTKSNLLLENENLKMKIKLEKIKNRKLVMENKKGFNDFLIEDIKKIKGGGNLHFITNKGEKYFLSCDYKKACELKTNLLGDTTYTDIEKLANDIITTLTKNDDYVAEIFVNL